MDVKFSENVKMDWRARKKITSRYYISKLKSSPEYEKIEVQKKLGQLPEIKLDEQDKIMFSDED